MAKLPTFEEMAQEVARRALDECEYEGKTIREWIEIIKAQPANGTDCISRQAAIIQLSHNKIGDDDHDMVVQKDIETIKQLPSTQPEIIYCKDCKHHWTHKCMDSMPIERCDLEQTFYDAERDFCSLAERREDG